ncbi:MAG: class I SAM-dependent methyltransferase [Alphaproteobacteria bacterium]|nr:MAG: class I SAM-dependent methyltransferase [Alphaproteobacteria bacterium]
MGESNALYYSSRDPLGEEGDFITAPEISQMFGELIGLWLADMWVRAGSPDPVHYVELGPGRGTLAQDALRTAERYGLKPMVHFVEGSEALREVQAAAIDGVVHHDDVSSIPDDAPILLVANEFFDALPVYQLIRSAQGWYERMVGLDGEKFVFVAGDKPMDSIVPDGWRTARQGTMIETSPAAAAVMSEIADRLVAQGGAALVIDYGSLESRSDSTLQAIRKHKKVDALSFPGEADMTAHVDFEMLGKVAKRQGARVEGTEMQGDWLHALGIDTRTEALQRRAPRAQADVIARQRDRLVNQDQMGLLFKVMGLASPDWPVGVGFGSRRM